MGWRRIALIAVTLVAAVGITFVLVDTIVTTLIERRIAAITQTPVNIGSISVSLRNGSATMRNLTVANPPGFTAPYVFELAEITVRLDTDTLFADPLVIREIDIEAPQVTAELDSAGKSNVEEIRRAVEKSARHSKRGGGSDAGGGNSSGRATEKIERRLIIELLAMHDGQVHVDARAAGGPQQSELLPGFELTNIGAEQGGATPAEVGRIVVTALARDVAVAVAATQLERYIGKEGSEWLKKGGAKAIQKGLGEVLDKFLRE